MANIDNVPKPPDLGLAAYSKQVYDSPSHQEKLKREEKEMERQERAIERQEKTKEKESDRWFSVTSLILGAILGALVVKLFDIFFK